VTQFSNHVTLPGVSSGSSSSKFMLICDECCAVKSAVLCCAVLCCAVLCCAVLCCAVLCSGCVGSCCSWRYGGAHGALRYDEVMFVKVAQQLLNDTRHSTAEGFIRAGCMAGCTVPCAVAWKQADVARSPSARLAHTALAPKPGLYSPFRAGDNLASHFLIVDFGPRATTRKCLAKFPSALCSSKKVGCCSRCKS